MAKIVACNSDINKIFYNGFTISKVYSCGGELVWGEVPIPSGGRVTLYNDLGEEWVSDCLDSSGYEPTKLITANDNANKRNMDDILEYFNNNTITAITIGDCIDTVGDFAFSDYTSVSSPHVTDNSSVKNITISDSVETIEKYAFSYMENLTAVTIGNSVETIGDAAFFNGKIRNIVIPDSVKTIGASAFLQSESPLSLSIGNSVETIGNSAFANYTVPTSLTIPPSVKTIGAGCFGGWGRLQNIIIPDSVTSLGYGAFANASLAKTLTIGTGLTEIQKETFQGCSSLSSVTIPNNIIYIRNDAFRECTSLTSVTFGSRLQEIGEEAFSNDTSLKTISFNNNLSTISAYAFSGCTSLESVTLPDSLITLSGERTNNSSAGGAFENCTSLSSVTFGSGLQEIGRNAFKNCGLTSLIIPDNITRIRNEAFYNNTSLKTVDIGENISQIDTSVFLNCRSLESVTVRAIVPPIIGAYVFAKTNNCPIYVPCESVSDYKAASGWSTYADRLFGIAPCEETSTYRYTESGTTCVGTTKYQNNIKEVSYNGGLTWETVMPEEYSASTVIEENCVECGYTELPNNVGIMRLQNDWDEYSVNNKNLDSNESISNFRDIDTSSSFDLFAFDMSGDTLSGLRGQTGTSGNDIRRRNILSIKTPKNTRVIADSAFQYNFNGTNDTTIIQLNEGLETIGHYAFQGIVSGLGSIDPYLEIPSTVTSIGEKAFDFDNSSWVTSGGNGFKILFKTATPPSMHLPFGGAGIANAENKITLYVPSGSKDAYRTAIDEAGDTYTYNSMKIKEYSGDKPSSWYPNNGRSQGLTTTDINGLAYTMTFSNGKTYSKANGSGYYSFNLPTTTYFTSNNMTKANLASITIGDCYTNLSSDAFSGCTSLTSVTLNMSSLTYLPFNTFKDCTSLTSCVISNGVTEIRSYSFNGCTSLASITIPNSVVTIGDQVFTNCSSLTAMTLPDSVESIGDYNFSGTSVENVVVGTGMTDIGSAFKNATSLRSLTVKAVTPPSCTFSPFYGCPSDLVIYVPSESLEVYKTTTYWKNYNIQPIP